jgi:CRISPR-associated protein Cas1
MTIEPTVTNRDNHESVEQIPARMINEYTYCPRLFFLEYVQQEWAHNADTLDGRFVHRRVDEERGRVPEPKKVVEMPRLHARSVLLGSDALGVTARVDVIEADDGRVIPVDYKRGAPPDVPEGAYEPERVQVCVQGLLLREHGYECDEGALYFAETNQRVRVELTDELVTRTQELIAEARRVAANQTIPPPLVRSPKCPRCSLVGICLPDETNLLREATAEGLADEATAENELPLPSKSALFIRQRTAFRASPARTRGARRTCHTHVLRRLADRGDDSTAAQKYRAAPPSIQSRRR